MEKTTESFLAMQQDQCRDLIAPSPFSLHLRMSPGITSLHFQFDCICSQLRNMLMGVAVRLIPERFDPI